MSRLRAKRHPKLCFKYCDKPNLRLPRHHDARKLAVLATIVGSIDCDSSPQVQSRFDTSEANIFAAKVLTGGRIDFDALDFDGVVQALEPC